MKKTSPGRKRFSPAQRQALLAAYRRSGLTQRDFAAQAGISLSCLSVWSRKSSRPTGSATPGFLELPRPLPVAPPSSPAAAYQLQFPSGLRLEVPRGFGAEELACLCGLLQRL